MQSPLSSLGPLPWSVSFVHPVTTNSSVALIEALGLEPALWACAATPLSQPKTPPIHPSRIPHPRHLLGKPQELVAGPAWGSFSVCSDAKVAESRFVDDEVW